VTPHKIMVVVLESTIRETIRTQQRVAVGDASIIDPVVNDLIR